MASKTTLTKKPLTKNELIQAIAEDAGTHEVNRRLVRQVLDSLQNVGYKQLKKVGVFTIPGFAKFRVAIRKKQGPRPGVNPQTKERIMLKAQPQKRVVRAKPAKACLDIVK